MYTSLVICDAFRKHHHEKLRALSSIRKPSEEFNVTTRCSFRGKYKFPVSLERSQKRQRSLSEVVTRQAKAEVRLFTPKNTIVKQVSYNPAGPPVNLQEVGAQHSANKTFPSRLSRLSKA